MAEDEAHLVLVLVLGEHLGPLGHGVHLRPNLVVALLQVLRGVVNSLLHVVLQHGQLGVLFLDFEGLFEVVDARDLGDNFIHFFVQLVRGSGVHLGGLVAL